MSRANVSNSESLDAGKTGIALQERPRLAIGPVGIVLHLAATKCTLWCEGTFQQSTVFGEDLIRRSPTGSGRPPSRQL